MKLKKQNIILHQLFILLCENEYLSVKKISSILNVSESTIRRCLIQLNETLAFNQCGKINKKPRRGISLILTNKEVAERIFANYELKNLITGENQIYRYLMLILSSNANKITLNELSEKLYDSLPVVRKNLDTCAKWLHLFDLNMNIKKNYGIYIEGTEENIRLAIKHIAINNDVYNIDESIRYFSKGIDLNLLKRCIYDIESQWNFKFSEESFHSMLIYAALAITRTSLNKLSIAKSEYETVQKYNEYAWSMSLFKEIEDKFYVQISEQEIIYFAIQLLCSHLIHSENFEDNNAYKYDEKIKQFIQRIISVVSDIMNMDLTKDKELYYGLLNHIRPAIFRMRFEKHSTTKLTNFIKEEYKHTYRVSWALSILFEEYYGINISSTELSYITLYIQTSIERVSLPINMALVTELGMGLNQMLVNKIKQAIPKVNKITIISLHDFNETQFKEYDVVVTTSASNHTNEKIIQISSVLSENGLTLIKQKIEALKTDQLKEMKKFDVTCHNLFDPRLMFTNIHVEDKNQLIKMLSDKLHKLGYISNKYHQSILKREKNISTYIGNGVAIPHGNSAFSNESKLAIAILDEPISWDNENKVDVIFLLAFKISDTTESKKIQLFYKGFLEIIETDDKLDYMKKLSSDDLYKYLLR
ncbi:MAG: PTS sugar transporter subunit IIA [Erysipelotrichaceae bacterium]